MTAKELHNDCLRAVSNCPQWKPHAYPDKVDKTLNACVKYWSFCRVLWVSHYCGFLSEEAKAIFSKHDKLGLRFSSRHW